MVTPKFREFRDRASLPLSIGAGALVLLLGLLPHSGCDRPGEAPSGPEADGAADPVSQPRLREIAEDAGLVFQHYNGMSGERFFCEMVAPGGALFDADGDGDLDLFVVQGTPLGGVAAEDTTFPPAPGTPLTDRLFRNLFRETGELKFQDATAESGIVGSGYSMGCAIGDVEGDGDPDLFVTHFGVDRLWINGGDGTFVDGTELAGLGDPRWTTSAAFADPDNDGDLDLFVCAYVDFRLDNHKPCYSATSAIDYCGPSSYRDLADRYYRNRGDGTFEDASSESRIGTAEGAGLGVVAADLDGDRWIDFYVANDGSPNRLWRNRGDGTFEDTALLAGCAYNRDGRAEASMGVDLADFDNDGDLDIFLTHLTDETNTLYRNVGGGLFEDASAGSGLGVPSRSFTGFGTAWFDHDLDGWLDLFVANGAVRTIESLARAGDPYPLHQPNQLFRNLGDGRFEEIGPDREPALAASNVSRGACFGDLDDDGAMEVVVLNNSGPLRLLHPRRPEPSQWVGLDLRRAGGHAPDLAARVRVTTRSGRELWRGVRVAASYLCANDPRLVIGLGTGDAVVAVEVSRPDGTIERWGALESGRYHRLVAGSGSAPEEGE